MMGVCGCECWCWFDDGAEQKAASTFFAPLLSIASRRQPRARELLLLLLLAARSRRPYMLRLAWHAIAGGHGRRLCFTEPYHVPRAHCTDWTHCTLAELDRHPRRVTLHKTWAVWTVYTGSTENCGSDWAHKYLDALGVLELGGRSLLVALPCACPEIQDELDTRRPVIVLLRVALLSRSLVCEHKVFLRMPVVGPYRRIGHLVCIGIARGDMRNPIGRHFLGQSQVPRLVAQRILGEERVAVNICHPVDARSKGKLLEFLASKKKKKKKTLHSYLLGKVESTSIDRHARIDEDSSDVYTYLSMQSAPSSTVSG